MVPFDSTFELNENYSTINGEAYATFTEIQKQTRVRIYTRNYIGITGKNGQRPKSFTSSSVRLFYGGIFFQNKKRLLGNLTLILFCMEGLNPHHSPLGFITVWERLYVIIVIVYIFYMVWFCMTHLTRLYSNLKRIERKNYARYWKIWLNFSCFLLLPTSAHRQTWLYII